MPGRGTGFLCGRSSVAEPAIAVIGLPGKWSTETLADAVAARTGSRYVVDMSEVALDLDGNRLLHQGQDIFPIPGTRTIERIDENANALSVELDDAVLERINEIAEPGVARGATLL